MTFIFVKLGSGPETHHAGAAQHLAEGVVDTLVAFQLGLTQRHQVILHLLVDPAVQHLRNKMTPRAPNHRHMKARHTQAHSAAPGPHLDAVHDVCVVVALLVSVGGRQREQVVVPGVGGFGVAFVPLGLQLRSTSPQCQSQDAATPPTGTTDCLGFFFYLVPVSLTLTLAL